MSEIQNKKYDLEDRTFRFAKAVIDYSEKVPKTVSRDEINKQLIRSASSVGANYIEANGALGRKDFIMRIRISRKEAKEARYWLGLSQPKKEQAQEKEYLIQEATELMRIFGAIIKTSGPVVSVKN
jgi:four helix bundle protein